MIINENTKKIIRHMPKFLQDGSNLIDLTNSVAQELEFSLKYLDDTKTQIQLSTATGIQLDSLAQLLNLTRITSEIDEDFRARILSHFNLSTSSGTVVEIKNVISALTGVSEEDITITEVKPGIIFIETFVGSNIGLVDTIFDSVDKTKAAGIYVFIDVSTGLGDTISFTDVLIVGEIADARFYGLFVYGEELSKY